MHMNFSDIADYIFELGQLKRIPHIGWLHAGIKDPERVGEHVFRASQIAYMLADAEGADPMKTTLMTLIHDNGEARIGDHDLITRKYVDTQQAEQQAFHDQSKRLPEHIAPIWKDLFDEREAKETKEARCSLDADMLEQAFQAKEYIEQGYQHAQRWIDNIEAVLMTESAQKLLAEMKTKSFMDWSKAIRKDQK